jgi:hypothetical protein
MKLPPSGCSPTLSRRLFCSAVNGHGTFVTTINTAHTVASRWAPMDFGQRHARNPPTIR